MIHAKLAAEWALWLTLLLFSAGTAHAQQERAGTGACSAVAPAEACYREGLDLALKAFRHDNTDESGVRQALERLRGACARGLGDACYMAGRIISADTAGTKVREPTSVNSRTLQFFTQACHASARPSAAACNALEHTFAYAPRGTVPVNTALHDLERGCRQGSAGACFRAATLMDDWSGPDAADVGTPAAPRECERSGLSGCLVAARRREARLTDVSPSARATSVFRREREGVMRLYRDVCQEGQPVACTALGTIWSRGRLGVLPDPDSAEFYLQMACTGRGKLWSDTLQQQLGDGSACLETGRLLLSGRSALDTARAVLHFKQGCGLIDSEACAEWAWHGLLTGELSNHLALLRAATACYEGSGYGCLITARLYGRGVLADNAQETSYLRRACDLRNGVGCTALGRRAGGDREMLKYLRRACTLRDGEGCRALARVLLEAGEEERARYFLVRACDYDDAEGCWLVSRLARGERREVEEGAARSRACRLDVAYCKPKD